MHFATGRKRTKLCWFGNNAPIQQSPQRLLTFWQSTHACTFHFPQSMRQNLTQLICSGQYYISRLSNHAPLNMSELHSLLHSEAAPYSTFKSPFAFMLCARVTSGFFLIMRKLFIQNPVPYQEFEDILFKESQLDWALV